MDMSIIQNIIKTKDYDLFNRKYSQIFKTVNTEILQILVSNNQGNICIILKTLEIVIMFKDKKYLDVISYIENNIKGLLLGKVRNYDVCISKILRMYYLARKELEMNNDIFSNLIVPNKELGNEESVSVITNCLLDYLISNNIYKRIDNEIVQPEISKFNFYNGVIELVEGNYEKAYVLLDSTIIKGSKKCVLNKKYLILASLLQSKFNITVDYDKKIKIYFDLIKIVKEGDLQAFMKFITDYKNVLLKENTYFIILRLSSNVIQEKIRCMSLIYSKISFDDMSTKLNIDKEDLNYLLLKSINLGLIGGYIKDKIYYSSSNKKNVNEKFNFESIQKLNKLLKSEMKYPDILPLCYEKVKQ